MLALIVRTELPLVAALRPTLPGTGVPLETDFDTLSETAL